MPNVDVKSDIEEPKVAAENSVLNNPIPTPTQELKPSTQEPSEEVKVSAFSISSIRAKRELQENNKSIVRDIIDL